MGRRERIEARLEDWGRSVHRHPWRAIGVMLAVTLGLASGAADLRFEASTENYLDPADPERSSYQAFRRQFVNDDTILLILHSERIFSFEFLARLRALHEDLEREVPLVDEVTSLINARVTRGSEDELIVEDLLETWPRSQAELEAVARRARSNPVYTNLLLSEDARFTTVTVNVTPTGGTTPDEGLGGFGEDGAEEGMAPASVEEVPILEGAELIRVVERLSEVTERHASADFPIYVTGNPEMTYSLVASSRRDMAVFTWVSLLVIGALLLLVFRRLSGVCIPLLVVILPLTATLGLMGWVGLPLTPSTQQLPTFLLVVGVADSVHLLTIFYRRLDAEDDREDAIGHALRHSGLAVVMTSLTTAGGLGSLAFADLTPIAGLGIAAPTGVLLALLYSLVLLPALVAVLPIRARRSSRREPGTLDRALGGVGDFCTRRPRTVVATWAVLVAAGGWGAFQLSLAYKPLSWFPETHPTRVAAEVANREMKGLMPLELLVDSGAANGLHEPELLRRIDEVQHFARSLAVNGIRPGQAISLVDVLKETHQALNANDPAYYAIPGDRRLVAQELLLFENSGSDDLEELVDRGFQTARVTLLVNYEDGLLYLPLVREVEDGARRILGDRVEITTTGLVKLWLRTITAMLWSTARSYSIALLVIAPLMVLLIGELRLGLLSLVPNLAPIVLGMGMMHWLGIPLDMFTLMVGTIAMGVAVDDTIHVMHGFRRERRRGADADVAVRDTLLSTGRALVITTVALSSGFFVQMLGTMISVRNVGFVTGFTLVAALVADLTLSPAMLVLFSRAEERRAAASHPTASHACGGRSRSGTVIGGERGREAPPESSMTEASRQQKGTR